MTDTPDDTQAAIAERLQDKLLKHFEALLDNGSASSTDLATLSRLLMANGWVLDRAKLPQGLRGMLTTGVSKSDFSDDADVLPFPKRDVG